MNRDRLKGAIDEVAGVAKQKTGELAGNSLLQAKGVAQHLKGKVESALGEAKDTIRKANNKTT